LIDSIATEGYIPADPIVVWQNEDNEKWYRVNIFVIMIVFKIECKLLMIFEDGLVYKTIFQSYSIEFPTEGGGDSK